MRYIRDFTRSSTTPLKTGCTQMTRKKAITVKYGGLVEKITTLILNYGPMTRGEICEHLDRDRQEVASIVSRMSKPGKTLPKRLYILRYVYDQENERRYPRAVYAIGDNPDAKRPGPQVKENKRRYNQSKRQQFTKNFVFNLGLPRRVYLKRSTDVEVS